MPKNINQHLSATPLLGCGGGGAPRDSAGSGATEEGLTSRGGKMSSGLPFQ